jgi:hypothetical protein
MAFAGAENRVLKDVRVLFTKTLFEPKGFMGGALKYSVMVILDKKNPEHMSHLKQLAADDKEVRTELWPNEADRPRGELYGSTWEFSIKNGDDATNKERIPYKEKNPELIGHWFIQPKNKKQVPVVDLSHLPLTETEVYSGCYCNVSVSVYAYDVVSDNGGKVKGVTIGLNGVQKVRDGERIGGGQPSPEDMFGAPVETGQNDASNYDAADPFGANDSGQQSQGDPLSNDIPF